MKRVMWSLVGLAALAPIGATMAQGSPYRPVVAVLYFDNNAIVAGAADYKGVEKGIADLLITELAANPRVRVVERDRIQQILAEQNLASGGRVDAETAIRIGRLLNACYSIIGGFQTDRQGNVRLTGRTVNNETSQVENPVMVSGKVDDVFAVIDQLKQRLNSDMRLDSCRPQRTGDASPTQQGAATRPANAQSSTPAAAPQVVEKFAKPLPPAAKKPKLDMRTALLYSQALDAIDAKDKTKAAGLLKQVLAKYPDFEQAKIHEQTVTGG
jgi:TolB-like protein